MFSPFSILPVALSRHVAYCNCKASIVRYPRYLSKVAIFIYINFFLTHFQNFQWFILVWLQTSLPDTSGTSSPCLNDYFIVLLHCICVNNNNLLMELDLKKTSTFPLQKFSGFFYYMTFWRHAILARKTCRVSWVRVHLKGGTIREIPWCSKLSHVMVVSQLAWVHIFL